MRSSLACLLTLLLGAPSVASAHGRPFPFVGDLHFHPTEPDTIIARATWGLAVSEDGGETWRWICATISGVDPTREDPPFAIMPDGAVLIGSFAGLSRSTPERCDFSFPDPDLEDVFVIDVHSTPTSPEIAYAVLTDGAGPDSLWRSTDMGQSFDPVGPAFDEILLERVRVAPSDPDRIYLSGAIPITAAGGARHAFVIRSRDGGETFTQTEVPLGDEERNLHLFAVDPTDPDRLLVRVVRRVTDARPERLLLSEDGGETFTLTLEARALSDAAFSPDGAQAYATSGVVEGLYRSDDGGRSFAHVLDGNLLCVETHGAEMWFCATEVADGYTLGSSTDGGDTVVEELYLREISALPDCPTCSQVGYVCPEWFPDLADDLQLDGGPGGGFDGGFTGAPRDAAPPASCGFDAGRPPVPDGGPPTTMDAGRDAGVAAMDAGPGPDPSGGCGCRVGARRGGPLWLAGIAALGALLTRRRRRG